MLGNHAGNSDTRSFDGQDFVDALALESSKEFLSHHIKEIYVHLVIKKAVNLKHIALFDKTVINDSLL